MVAGLPSLQFLFEIDVERSFHFASSRDDVSTTMDAVFWFLWCVSQKSIAIAAILRH